MPHWSQGHYTPKHPEKYVGNKLPKYRSGWELTFMMFCDNHPSVVQWASEPIRIPYRNPLTGKNTNYVPDFIVVYENKNGRKVAELVEIKPKKQSLIESNKASKRDRAIVAVNHAKWAAAQSYCKSAGLKFRVINEGDIFASSRK